MPGAGVGAVGTAGGAGGSGDGSTAGRHRTQVGPRAYRGTWYVTPITLGPPWAPMTGPMIPTV